MKITVLGASGQLGHCLQKAATTRGLTTITFPNEQEADILNSDLLNHLFEKDRPQFVINCAAYTAVDKAEDDIERCRQVNRVGAANVARACKQYGATLVHISTDFVFKGDVPKLLNESDPTHPDNVYGLTKLEGEQDTEALLPAHLIIRTSWLYSEFGNNFVKTMLRLGHEREQLGVIVDQVGSPTYAMDLAHAVLDIIGSNNNAYGIYHYSNEGVVSWYDFAQAIFEESATIVKLLPLKTSEYPTKAVRPAWSGMDKSKIKATFGLKVPYWRESLRKCLQALEVQTTT